ncbi:transposase [Microbacterium sp. F2E]|uniref:transposase n=1 Tax=Microbacterium sp. F2E TaxID=2895284 RepID=UPI001E431732|nr:transposase [Microbacterium sp. F2E]MCC9055073.1 transposase [Microbacterium sp. F2E]
MGFVTVSALVSSAGRMAAPIAPPPASKSDIAKHLSDLYGSDVSRDLVSTVTDKVLGDMQEWQARPLDVVYPVVLIDALVIKVRGGQVANRPVYVAVGIDLEGHRDVLGLWMGPTGGEGAKQWMNMLTELRNRGVADVCIVCCYAVVVVMPMMLGRSRSAAVGGLRLSA